MITTRTHNTLTWIDVEAPTGDEIQQLMADYSLHPLVAEELKMPSTKAKVDIRDHHLFLALHFPVSENGEKAQEIDFVIGKNYCITLHYEPLEPLSTFLKIFETHAVLNKDEKGSHGGFLFYYIIKKMYRSVADDLDTIREKLLHVEREIFKGNERRMVEELSKQGRRLLDIKHTLVNHKDVLDSFAHASGKFFGAAFSDHAESLVNDFNRLYQTILGHKEYMHDLRDTNDSLLSAKQSEITKVFTILAFVTFPLALVLDVISIPSEWNPLYEARYDFWIIAGFVVIAALFEYWFFKSKKWL